VRGDLGIIKTVMMADPITGHPTCTVCPIQATLVHHTVSALYYWPPTLAFSLSGLASQQQPNPLRRNERNLLYDVLGLLPSSDGAISMGEAFEEMNLSFALTGFLNCLDLELHDASEQC